MTPSGARTCAGVWELTAYTNGYVANTNHFSGELHRPIQRLGAAYGLSSLTELPPPILTARALSQTTSVTSTEGEEEQEASTCCHSSIAETLIHVASHANSLY